MKEDRQGKYDVTSRRFCVTIVTLQKHWLLYILSVCL